MPRLANDTTESDVVAAHEHSSRHRQELMASECCGCFYCLAIYPPGEIKEWIDERDADAVTALCPRCGIDAVIGSASGYPVTVEFLAAMRRRWFGGSYRRPISRTTAVPAALLLVLIAGALGVVLAAVGASPALSSILLLVAGIALAGFIPTTPSILAGTTALLAHVVGHSIVRHAWTGLPVGWFWPTTVLGLATIGFVGSALAAVVSRRYWPPVRDPDRCAACGYRLFGLPELRCPECGTPFAADRLSRRGPPS